MRSVPAVEFASLGTWGRAALLAEYDPERDVIRVDAHIVASVRASLGESAAASFVAYALAHERYHRAHPTASEAQAHSYAEAQTGVAAQIFEAVVRERGDAERSA